MTTKLFLLAAAVTVSTAACAQTKKTTKKTSKKAANFTLIEAYKQTMVGGVPGGLQETGHHFVIKWQAASYPETFFWRGENGWMTCKIEEAHKVTNRKTTPRGIDYNTRMVTGEEIHTGDTLMITPVKGGRYPVPAEIPATAKNTLYYKVGGSGWLAYPVKNMGKKADVTAP